MLLLLQLARAVTEFGREIPDTEEVVQKCSEKCEFAGYHDIPPVYPNADFNFDVRETHNFCVYHRQMNDEIAYIEKTHGGELRSIYMFHKGAQPKGATIFETNGPTKGILTCVHPKEGKTCIIAFGWSGYYLIPLTLSDDKSKYSFDNGDRIHCSLLKGAGVDIGAIKSIEDRKITANISSHVVMDGEEYTNAVADKVPKKTPVVTASIFSDWPWPAIIAVSVLAVLVILALIYMTFGHYN